MLLAILLEILRVGPGQKYARIEDAVRDAKPGDVVEVTGSHEKVAVYITQPRITIRAAKGAKVVLSGKGFDYSGTGSTPRAVFQFNKGADDGVVEGFEITGAHNGSHNGAAVRIQDACRVTVRDCDIHGNDMGIMSGGAAEDQLIESCHIHRNGQSADPGFNHNLYLGGVSVTVRSCEIAHSLTGHNVKSRAHRTRVEYSYVHDSAHREFDLVDSKQDTTRPQSDAIVLGCVIVKAKNMEGNRTVFHFGQDTGHEHDGTLTLVHNTIVTPYGAPVIDLSAPKAKAHLAGNILWDAGAKPDRQLICEDMSRVTGSRNWMSRGFQGLKLEATIFGADPGLSADYRLARPANGIVDGGAPLKVDLAPAWQYRHPRTKEKRRSDGRPDLGAYER